MQKNTTTVTAFMSLVFGGFLTGTAVDCYAAIIYPKAPAGGAGMVEKMAGGAIRSDPPFFKGLHIEDLTVAAPCQSYSVGLTDLISGKLVSVAKTGVGGGWQYPLLHGTRAVGLAWLTADGKTGNALKCYELGGSADGKMEALRVAEQLPQVKKQDYEIRSLDRPWFLFVAVWLHGKTDDIIIPLPDRWGRWNGCQPYSPNQIIELLKPEAEKKLKQLPGTVD
jgi:hypothetical protein